VTEICWVKSLYKIVFSAVIPDKSFYETECQNFVGTSHFLLTENESNFIFRVKTQAIVGLHTPQRQPIALTIPFPSLHVLQGRASFLLLLHKPKRVATVEGERSRQERTSPFRWSSTTLTLGLRISLIYTLPFI